MLVTALRIFLTYPNVNYGLVCDFSQAEEKLGMVKTILRHGMFPGKAGFFVTSSHAF